MLLIAFNNLWHQMSYYVLMCHQKTTHSLTETINLAVFQRHVRRDFSRHKLFEPSFIGL